MASFRLAAVIKNSDDDEFLVIKQAPPPPLPEEEYQRFIDSDLWDLPSTPLNPLNGDRPQSSDISIQGADSIVDKVDLGKLDVDSALDQVASQVSMEASSIGNWVLLKYVEEPEFGPGPLIHTLFILGISDSKVESLQDFCKWMSKDCALNKLVDVSKSCDRVGPLAFIALLHDSIGCEKWKMPQSFPYQEYPPGVMLVPMRSRTAEPFHTTNLIVMVPDNGINKSENSEYIAYGDALLMDPGCCTQSHSELADLVAALPRKLVVFVTHHHYDHTDGCWLSEIGSTKGEFKFTSIDSTTLDFWGQLMSISFSTSLVQTLGLSVVQKCNPDSVLLAHDNTMNRIYKGAWSRGYTSISGGEKIHIGGQDLQAIGAPGHTDGHLALLHLSTNSLIVGDHCVGHGSAVLDVKAGGNMKDYFLTTYDFLELSPHVLIPMHGRINLWPKNMLCGYLRNRRAREMSILKAIESGSQTLFDITSKVYADVDTRFWIPASSNVRIHVDHLAVQEKLPKEFSMEKFQASCRIDFKRRWAWTYLKGRKVSAGKVLTVLAVAGVALSLAVKLKH